MSFAPICVACAREMRCRKNGYFFKDYGAAAIWAGDMFECEGCKAKIVVGVGREPVVEAHEPEELRSAWPSGFELTREPPVSPITNDTIVVLNDGEWDGPFADFCASNKFEDDEIAEIETALNAIGLYEGGGGAMAEFKLEVAR